jgi:uncharacterized protein YcbX
MLVDAQHQFLTQRSLPKLALFKTMGGIGETAFSVRYNQEDIAVPHAATGEPLQAQVWDDGVEVLEVDASISRWFSRYLGFDCKLVFFPESNERKVDPAYALDASNNTSLSDGYPVLAIGQSSLDDLNRRLIQPVGMERFRPNLVFTGAEAFAEDTWKQIKAGNVEMACVKPCARCVMTTIDQQTGTVGKEPLATLNTYRKVGNKVLFGQNVIPLGEGEISVGDEII